MLGAAVRREVALEILDPFAQDEVLRFVNLFGDAEDLVADRCVLLFQIEKRYSHGAREFRRNWPSVSVAERRRLGGWTGGVAPPIESETLSIQPARTPAFRSERQRRVN